MAGKFAALSDWSICPANIRDMPDVAMQSTITCPQCGYKPAETMLAGMPQSGHREGLLRQAGVCHVSKLNIEEIKTLDPIRTNWPC
jgi:hypothetical protein